jgi:hypothetical protein
MRRWSDAIAGGLLPLALLAATLGILAPSARLAGRADLLLAELVLLTVLAVDPEQLMTLRTRSRTLAALSLGPFLVLAPVA